MEKDALLCQMPEPFIRLKESSWRNMEKCYRKHLAAVSVLPQCTTTCFACPDLNKPFAAFILNGNRIENAISQRTPQSIDTEGNFLRKG